MVKEALCCGPCGARGNRTYIHQSLPALSSKIYAKHADSIESIIKDAKIACVGEDAGELSKFTSTALLTTVTEVTK